MIFLMLVDTDEERDKLEALYHRYKGMMFSLINDIINDEHLSEDILQETFIKIAKNIDKVNDDIHSSLAKSFIITIARNTAFDYYRKNARLRKNEYFLDEFEETVFCDSEEDLSSKIDPENRIISIIKSMKDSYRDIFILRYVHELENDEIAKLLNITEETVRKRLSRGKKMIEEKLEGMGK